MSLMYSDVTANEGEAARALAVSTTAVLAGVEETLSPPERTQAMRKRKPSLRRKGTSLQWTCISFRKLTKTVPDRADLEKGQGKAWCSECN